MMIRGYSIATRTVVMAISVLVAVLAILYLMSSCQKRRSMAAQERVEDSQARAQTNSAADAIGTVSRSGEAQAASEGQSRQAERDIRSAEGANQAVNPAARDAGISALCKRAIYKDDPRCKAR